MAEDAALVSPPISDGFGSGAAAADFDRDGDVDLFVPTELGEPDQVFRNLGTGQFEEVAASLNLASTDRGRSALWFDYDGDSRLDLLVFGDCYQLACDSPPASYLRLHRQNASGTFDEVTQAAGLTLTGLEAHNHAAGIAAGDLNQDGYLDLAYAFWDGPFHLWLNQRDGSFLNITLTAGLGASMLDHWQPVIVDFNGDGLLDIYVAVDHSRNRLWIHQGNTPAGIPTFADEAVWAGCDNDMNDMGLAIGDYDEDGDPDFYATNIYIDGRHNVLLRNDSTNGIPYCTERSYQAGVEEGGWGWGTTFIDADNDGDLDLGETNGLKEAEWFSPPRLFIHDGEEAFQDEATTSGLTDTDWGSVLLAADFDRDGDLDLLQTQPPPAIGSGALAEHISIALYENQLAAGSADHHFLVVRPRSTGPNRNAIGSMVRATIGEQTQTRWITAGISFLGQEPAEAVFGLGSATVVDQLEIVWPNGESSFYVNVPADQTLTLTNRLMFRNGFE